jgi:hypothetical protein
MDTVLIEEAPLFMEDEFSEAASVADLLAEFDDDLAHLGKFD